MIRFHDPPCVIAVLDQLMEGGAAAVLPGVETPGRVQERFSVGYGIVERNDAVGLDDFDIKGGSRVVEMEPEDDLLRAIAG